MTRIIFNPFAQSFRQNPYPTYRAMREAGAFRALGMWVFARHDDVKAVLRDRRFSSALIPAIVEGRLAEFGMVCPEVSKLGKKAIVFTDNPEHARLRRLANVVFSRDLLEGLRPLARRLMREHLDSYLRGLGDDFISRVARPLPLKLLLSWMEIDHVHLEAVARWNHEIRYFLEPGTVTRDQFAQIYASLKGFLTFFSHYIEARRAGSGSDLISQMATRRTRDDSFTAEEVAYMCVMAFVAGAETTQALLGNAAWLLATHPAELERLLSGQVTVGQAADEILRFETPLQMTKRVATEDAFVGGVDIKAGDQLLLCLAAGNHDDAIFPHADTFNIGRANADQHLGFGYGAHACLGAHLAQIQVEALLDELVARRSLRLSCVAAPVWQSHSVIVRGLDSLTLATDQRGDALADDRQIVD
ncbi:hypothetical protein CF70_032570 [Cupriavidus sp. SK-3]|uniref:cytochrome P450 n=1 Tax=Cupriavidus sp. SK-3 TaxID=1470558 RepID=UPI00045200E2|nr:cytochrome P450 [Cupriavidus sp. SK-3]KDP88105.1 hypothetical protein CF70_032570 [Cupriavidus sp. SK-3]